MKHKIQLKIFIKKKIIKIEIQSIKFAKDLIIFDRHPA
jgi:hypothetical protein